MNGGEQDRLVFEPEMNGHELAGELLKRLSQAQAENLFEQIPWRTVLRFTGILGLIGGEVARWLGVSLPVSEPMVETLGLVLLGLSFLPFPAEWLDYWSSGAFLRSVTVHARRELCAYEVGIWDGKIGYLLDGEPVEEVEWFEIEPVEESPMWNTMQEDDEFIYGLPLSYRIADLFDKQDAVKSIELKSRLAQPIELNEIAVVKNQDWNLEVHTERGRILRIPRFFPTPVIARELEQRVPDAFV